MMLAAVFLSATLTLPAIRVPPPPAQASPACLHEPGKEAPAQRDRSIAALAATRAINTAQSSFAAKNNRTYARREELAAYLDASRYNLIEGTEIVPGFELTFDRTEKGYWLMIADKTDPCGFRYISNQQGIIFVGQPIR
jgi:hypothetical protein